MRIIIISPSGKFYGSEQVLYDYLSETSLRLDVYVPAKGVFVSKLQDLKLQHWIRVFNSSFVTLFYIKLIYSLAIGKFSSVYCNEAGHVRYITLLARIFSKINFIIQVRINEDTAPGRWPIKKPKNLELLVISKFIQNKLNFNTFLLYDPYRFQQQIINASADSKLKIGIIGRISVAKGFNHLIELLDFCKEKDRSYQFLLYGDPDPKLVVDGSIDELKTYENVHLMGFCYDKTRMYESVNCVLHLCSTEPLGRIFLEAIDLNIPFVGFNAGGIGEIGEMTGLTELLVSPDEKNIPAAFIRKLEIVEREQRRLILTIYEKKKMAEKIFDLKKYTTCLDSFLTNIPVS